MSVKIRTATRDAGMPTIDLTEASMHALAARLVPEKVARRHTIVPMTVDDGNLTYATATPPSVEVDQDVAFASGRRVKAVLAPRAQILAALDRAYPKLGDVEVLLGRIRSQSAVESVDAITATPSASAVIDLCNHILARAVEAGASDVHVECTPEAATVRFRVCGILEPMLTLPAGASMTVRNRFKIMAKADIAVHQRPQDGAFRVLIDSRPIDVRLSTLPTFNGEKIVLRVIDGHSELHRVKRLGYGEAATTRLCRALSCPDGLVLVTGPTGSGKTTALYAAINELRDGRRNIITVEDPVERRVDGISQIPVNAKQGSDWGTILRSVLRQDPDVLMIGEIRDAEVAAIAGQAAYTGRLVLSSLHTNDAATAVTRLLNLGLEPFRIAETLRAVVSQRLLRRLCPSCQRKVTEFESARLARTCGVAPSATAGPGCAACRHTGYAGRLPVVEILTPDEALRSTIAKGATAHEIRAAMAASGSPTMRSMALEYVASGETSIEEVERVLSTGEAAPIPERSDRRRVLVADDEPMTRMLVKVLLERDGFEVMEAGDGGTAIELLGRERPDLMVLDLNMPGIDGYTVLRHTRQQLSLATLPVIVLTGDEGPGVQQRVLQLGADDFALKPFDAAALVARVRAAFRRVSEAAA